MKNKNTILTSLLITITYLTIACIYFFGGFINPISESAVRQIFETILTLPAILIFLVGFGSGSFWGYLTGLIIFLILWGLFALFIYLIKTKNNGRK